ncbi:hypothetical protein SUDANB105_07284 [Streptomyces sp. enrichment culture]
MGAAGPGPGRFARRGSAILITAHPSPTQPAPPPPNEAEESRPTVFQETPIYSRLIAERGDIPLQVRSEADRIRRDLEAVMRVAPSPASGLPGQLGFPGPPR